MRFAAFIVAAVFLALALPQPANALCRCGTYSKTTRFRIHETFLCEPEPMTRMYKDMFCCEDDRLEFPAPNSYDEQCGSVPFDLGLIEESDYHCNFNTASCSQRPDWTCNGLDDDGDGVPDESCSDKVCEAIEKDEHPVRFATGSVEIGPKIIFSRPVPNSMFFGVALRWYSHARRVATDVWIHNQTATNFIGEGWIEAYDDRLIIVEPRSPPLPNTPAATIGWQSFEHSQTFDFVEITGGTARYLNPTSTHELLDFGAQTSPRYRITRRDDGVTWEFEAVDYSYGTPTRSGRAGVLVRIAGLGYAIDIDRDSFGRTSIVTDSLGRRLSFTHEAPAGHRFHRLATVSYEQPGGTTSIVARFLYTSDQQQLRAIYNSDDATRGYLRFRRWDHPSIGTPQCEDCRGLISEVIQSVSSTQLPAADAAVSAGENVIEGHIYEPHAPRSRAIGSYGPERRWGYIYDETPTCESGGACRTVQVDLHHPTGESCDVAQNISCPGGSECWSEDQGALIRPCYPAIYIDTEAQSRRVVARTGHLLTGDEYYDYDDAGRLIWSVDGDGIRTTYSYNAEGRPSCMVVDDDNGEAGQPPSCDAPSNAIVHATTYLGAVEILHTPGFLPESPGITIEGERDEDGRLIRERITGSTRTLDGVMVLQHRTRFFSYEGGLISRYRGYADDDTTYFDRAEYEYADGFLSTVRRIIGPAAAPRIELTRYENYDEHGVAQRIVEPNGRIITRTISSDRRVWIEEAGTPPFRVERGLHFDGTLRYQIDGDDVCLTYEHRPDKSLVKRSRRGDAACGVVPIQESSGEVKRLRREGPGGVKITRQELLASGAVQFDESYTFDQYGRPLEIRRDGAARRRYQHELTRMTATDEINIRTERSFDTWGRPDAILRELSPGSFVATELSYETPADILPAAIARGPFASAFVYDDFAEIIETTTPEGGTTRYTYDAVGRLLQSRANGQTAAINYDVYGRELGIDYDREHPADNTADVVYRWDNCDASDTPSGFVCGNGYGRLTMARAILGQQNGELWSRATWFAYDLRGRVVETATAEKIGTTMSPAHRASYSYTPGGRLLLVGNPLSSAHGTSYTRMPDGRIANVRSSGSQQVLTQYLDYLSFGPSRRIVSNGAHLDIVFDDDQPSSYTWTPEITLSYSYDQGGHPLARGGRYLTRDPLGRITCESSSPEVCGSSYSYDDPFDRRATGAGNIYQYDPVTSRLARLIRADGSEIVYAHDDAGRRTSETEAADPNANRAYTYNPDGRLGRIDGHNYSLFLHRDAFGRVTQVIDSVSGFVEEYFYDLADRLVAAQRQGATLPASTVLGAIRGADLKSYVAWWSDGTYSIGSTFSALDNIQLRRPYARRAGNAGIAGVTQDTSGRIVTYYSDGVAGYGTQENLAGGATFNFQLASGKTMSQVLAIACNTFSNGRFYVWYDDGTYSVGDAVNLGRYGTGTYNTGLYPRAQIQAIVFRPPLPNESLIGSFRTVTFHTSAVLIGGITSLASQSAETWFEPPAPNAPQRWAFHWAGSDLVASTRELIGGSTSVQRFAHAFDERGMPVAMIGEDGTIHARIETTSFGERTITLNTPDPMWIPFALPGQIVLERTGGTKPPLALNGAREYDPLTGRFLQPDPADRLPREDPEGYVYGRHDPSRFLDPTGLFTISDKCSSTQRYNISKAIFDAAVQIARCKNLDECVADKWKRGWINALITADYSCSVLTYEPEPACARVEHDGDRSPIVVDSDTAEQPESMACECLSNTVAHEALHVFDRWDDGVIGNQFPDLGGLEFEVGDQHGFTFPFTGGYADYIAARCIVCNPDRPHHVDPQMIRKWFGVGDTYRW